MYNVNPSYLKKNSILSHFNFRRKNLTIWSINFTFLKLENQNFSSTTKTV